MTDEEAEAWKKLAIDLQHDLRIAVEMIKRANKDYAELIEENNRLAQIAQKMAGTKH